MTVHTARIAGAFQNPVGCTTNSVVGVDVAYSQGTIAQAHPSTQACGPNLFGTMKHAMRTCKGCGAMRTCKGCGKGCGGQGWRWRRCKAPCCALVRLSCRSFAMSSAGSPLTLQMARTMGLGGPTPERARSRADMRHRGWRLDNPGGEARLLSWSWPAAVCCARAHQGSTSPGAHTPSAGDAVEVCKHT